MKIRPRHTNIKQAIEVNEGWLIREDYYKYPKGESNIYLLNKDLKVVWFAELPMDDDVYANPINMEGTKFTCASWKGITCTLSLLDGKIIDSLFTK